MRFWVSWYDAEEDYRPLHDPPGPGILGWWCSGETCEDPPRATLVVFIDAPSEAKARAALKREWPETANAEFRFFEEQPESFRPGDRFPLPDWSPLVRRAPGGGVR